MDMCMEAFQEGRGMSNGVPLQGSANNNNFNPVYVASVDVPGSLYELAMDAIPVFEESFSNISNNTSAYNFPQQQQQQVTSFGSSPFPWQVLDPALLLCDPVWQRARFECPAAVDPMKMQYRELQNSFEERQAALAEQLVEMGRAYNNRNINNNIMRLQQLEAVQSVLETTNVPTEGHAINSLYENIGCNWRPIKIEPGDGSGAGAAVGYGAENSLQFNNYFAPLCDSPVSSSNSAIQLQQQRKSEKCRRESLNPGSAEVTVTGAYEGGGGWQCAITNQLLGYDSLPDLHTVNGDHASDSSNYQLIAMPPHTIFHALPPPTAQFTESSLPAFPLQEPQLSPAPAWQNQPKPSDSYAPIEPPAKRPRTSCYTLEDILKRLPRGAALGLRTIRSNESSPRNISPAPQFSSDLSLASPRLSCSGASSSLEKDYDEKQQQQYRKPSYASVEPQSIAARHRRKKISEKIRCLEKLIPGGCKLDTARMLEEAIKYVRFLQAQVHVLECMPSAESKDTRSNPAKDNRSLSLRSNIYKEGSWNVSLANALALQRSTLAASLLKKLSAQQMLHILVTSPTIQRKLFSAEKCVGTVEQKKMLVAAEALLSYDFSSFRHTDD